MITNVSSVAAVCVTAATAYKTSKAGINAYTQTLAIGNAKYGIRANAIMPGLMETPMAIEGLSQELGIAKEKLIAQRNAAVPLGGQMGTAWDVAWAAVFLASDEARFITLRTFPGIGGFIVWMGHDPFPCPCNTAVLDFHGRMKPAALALQGVFLSKAGQP